MFTVWFDKDDDISPYGILDLSTGYSRWGPPEKVSQWEKEALPSRNKDFDPDSEPGCRLLETFVTYPEALAFLKMTVLMEN